MIRRTRLADVPTGAAIARLKLLALLAALISVAPARAQSLEVVAELATRPGNPAITPDGRIILSQQPLDKPQYKVVEVAKDGSTKPFPNESWSRDRLTAVLGVRVTADGTVWMLDMGDPRRPAKLVAWDTKSDRLAREIPIPVSARRPNSFLQDFAVDERRGVITIADMTAGNLDGESHPALVIVDIASGSVRRVLEGHPSFRAEDLTITIDGRPVAKRRPDGAIENIRFGLNGIAIDPAGEWIYFGAVSGRNVWRIPAEAIADTSLTESMLAARIERYADKRPSDGLAVDAAGRVFVTDLENSSVGVATPEGYSILVRDPRLSWPDGFSFAADGSLYVLSTQLHRHPDINQGKSTGKPPFLLFRVKGAAAGGRVFNIDREAKRLPERGPELFVDRQLIGEPDAGVRMFRVDRPLPRHMHRRSDEYLYVVSGSASVVVADEPARTIKAGDLIHYRRGTWHEVPTILQKPFVVMAFETPPRAPSDIIFSAR